MQCAEQRLGKAKVGEMSHVKLSNIKRERTPKGTRERGQTDNPRDKGSLGKSDWSPA
jgi:hypothetical protein